MKLLSLSHVLLQACIMLTCIHLLSPVDFCVYMIQHQGLLLASESAIILALLLRNEKIQSALHLAKHSVEMPHDQVQEEVQIRMNHLANDLHDVAQSNIAISRTLISKLIQDLKGNMTDKQMRDYKLVDEAIESARLGIRNISQQLKEGNGISDNSESAGPSNLLENLTQTLSFFQETQVLTTRITTRNLENIMLPHPLLCDIGLMVRESINNILVHAQAQNLHLHIERQQENLLIVIKDDGNGFEVEPNNLKQLHALKTRVKKVSGKLSIRSQKDMGTALTISVPV